MFRNSALLINRWPSFALRWSGPIVWMNLLPNRLSEISPFLIFIQKVFLSNCMSGWLRCPIVYLNGSLVHSSVLVVTSSSCLPKWAPCQFVYRNCSLVKMSVWLVHFSSRLSEWFSCSIVCLSCSLLLTSVLIGSLVPASICIVSCKSFVLVGSCLIVWLSIPFVWFALSSNRQSEWFFCQIVCVCLSGPLVQTYVWLVLHNRLSE